MTPVGVGTKDVDVVTVLSPLLGVTDPAVLVVIVAEDVNVCVCVKEGRIKEDNILECMRECECVCVCHLISTIVTRQLLTHTILNVIIIMLYHTYNKCNFIIIFLIIIIIIIIIIYCFIELPNLVTFQSY